MKESPSGIGGWLLVLMIWLGISLLIGTIYNLYTIFISWNGGGLIQNISLSVSCAFLVWYAWYACVLFDFVKLRLRSVKKVKLVLILGPALNILYPFICGAIFSYYFPVVDLGEILKNIYTPDSAYSYLGPVIISIIWYIYLNKSRRVANTYS